MAVACFNNYFTVSIHPSITGGYMTGMCIPQWLPACVIKVVPIISAKSMLTFLFLMYTHMHI